LDESYSLKILRRKNTMKFGVREICDVVFRAKAPMKVGNKIFYKNEPVIYFDTLKTSTLEGAATTVYAQGGRGNARLMSWDGERTVTFTMEDALISPEGLAILTGAGLMEASTEKPIYVHTTETIALEARQASVVNGALTVAGVNLQEEPATTDDHSSAYVYAMLMDPDGNVISEPFTNTHDGDGRLVIEGKTLRIIPSKENSIDANISGDIAGYKLLVDYYVKKTGSAMEINITPDKFGGAFYIEASTLFREYPSQRDLPAEFIIPNGRVQSNFTFTMAGSGDPSTFTFTVDAFPDYTRFNGNEKVLATIQVIGGSAAEDAIRESTKSMHTVDTNGLIIDNDTTVMDADVVAAIEAIAAMDGTLAKYEVAETAISAIEDDAAKLAQVYNYHLYAAASVNPPIE
jgi:hypothetical protein